MDVQGRNFTSKTVVSGSMTSTLTHPGKKSVLKLLRVGLPPTPRSVLGRRTSRGTAFALYGFLLHSSLDFSGGRMLTGTRDTETGSVSRSSAIKQ